MLLIEQQNIRETYDVEKFLGEGAFAEVYRVRHRFLGRQAMKVFKRTGMTLDDTEKMLFEAIMLSQIGHPNIVRVFDANVIETDRGRCGYFTMENVSGGSLDKFWHSHGTTLVPVETTVDLMKQICRGLSVAHKQTPSVIHRDIKPQNILVGYEVDGLRARLSDFGLAKSVNPLTLLATAAGTPQFKPPEAFSDSKGDSCSADIWAIGTTLYLLLTDNLPFVFPDNLGWGANNIFNAPVAPPSDFNPDVNAALDAIVLRALDLNAGCRYQNADEMLDALNSWHPGKPHAVKTGNDPMVSKTALGGNLSSPNENEAQKLASEALGLKKFGKLNDAADLMEEAFNKSPQLREKYANQVRLWRCGISM